jgi:ferredoxin-NADP reductase
MTTQEIPLVGYQSKLLNRVEVAEGTMAFHFERPAGFDFKPGQSADLTLLDPPERTWKEMSALSPLPALHSKAC